MATVCVNCFDIYQQFHFWHLTDRFHPPNSHLYQEETVELLLKLHIKGDIMSIHVLYLIYLKFMLVAKQSPT